MKRAVIFDMFETLITHYGAPLYFGAQIAEDAGIPAERFLPAWHSTESDRTVGKMTLPEVIERILRENQCYSEELVRKIVEKRMATKKACFRNLNPQIVPMLAKLRERGVLVGLISNCYFEEAVVIRESELFPYFDAVCLSCEMGVKKPDEEIYRRCMEKLSVRAEDCLYVGDGGSFELETARRLGMTAVQAVWYFKEGLGQESERKPDFVQLEKPLEVLGCLEGHAK